MDTLGDAFPREQARVRELLGEYLALGIVGRFGAAHLAQTLHEADEALRERDTVAMLRLYAQMQRIK